MSNLTQSSLTAKNSNKKVTMTALDAAQEILAPKSGDKVVIIVDNTGNTDHYVTLTIAAGDQGINNKDLVLTITKAEIHAISLDTAFYLKGADSKIHIAAAVQTGGTLGSATIGILNNF